MALIVDLARGVVALTGLYFTALGVTVLTRPDRATRFLLGFAGSPAAHYTELSVRLVVGAALVLAAPQLIFSGAFKLFGWVLLGTTACLLLVPWRWHQRFAQQAVPRAIRHIALIGVASLALGGFMLAALVRGSVP
jgi:hypothetical protein